MKNALSYFYNIFIDNIQKISDDYYFIYQNNNYIVTEFIRSLDEAQAIYALDKEMLNSGISVYEIILTIDNNIIFYYEEKNYILMRLPSINNRLITYDDVLNFHFIPTNKLIKKIDKSNWPYYWENKIDFFEYQFSQVQNKHTIINQSINYYIGMWENAISYYNDNFISNNYMIKEVCHKRINCNMDLLSYLNPLNLVVDYKMRDVSEYLKSYVLSENFTVTKINSMLDKIIIDKDNAILLISRSLFPSLYFDLYEKIVVDNYDENELLDIIKKHNYYRILLKVMFERYNGFNIPIINWIMKEKS